jgi:uncharacterized membrane protein (DUF485 family)
MTICNTLQFANQLGIVIRIALVITCVVRRIYAWRATQRMDTNSRIVGERGKAGVFRGVTRLRERVL